MGLDETGRGAKMKRSLFFGWWTVVASGIMNFWGYGSWSYGFGVYFQPLQEEFGWTRAQISAGASMRMLEGSAEGPLGGYFTDKHGPRAVNLAGMLLAGLGLILMYFVNSLVSFYLIWGFVVSTGFNTGLSAPLDAAIANWFVKKRGLANSISRVGLGFGGVVVPTFMTLLLIWHGWRMAFVIAGLITWAIGIPLTWFFVRPKRPEYYGLLPDGASPEVKVKTKDIEAMIRAGQVYTAEKEEVEFSLRQAMRIRAFWIEILSSSLRVLCFRCVSIHQIPHLIDMGVDPILAAGVLGFMAFMSIPGRVFAGVLADRSPTRLLKYLWILARSLETLGLFILLRATTIEMVYLYTVVYGLGLGLSAGSGTPIRGRYYGRKGYATISGIISLIQLPANVIAPIYVGWVYDVTNSYVSAFTQAIVLQIAGIASLYFFDPPKKRPDALSDIKKFI